MQEFLPFIPKRAADIQIIFMFLSNDVMGKKVILLMFV